MNKTKCIGYIDIVQSLLLKMSEIVI